MGHRLVAHRLAGDTGAYSGQRFAPLLRDRLAAIIAFLRTLAVGRQCAGAENGLLHRILDLLLDRAVARPSAGHDCVPTLVIPDLIRDPPDLHVRKAGPGSRPG